MSKQTKTVHFSLGSNFGNLMGNIAQEKLIYNLNPEAAIKTFTDSFIGMDDKLAIKLISGDEYVLVPANNDEVTIRKRVDGDSYPLLNGTEIVTDFIRQIATEAKEFGRALCTIYQLPLASTRNYMVNMPFSFDDLLSLFEINGHSKSQFYDSLKDKVESIKDEVLYDDPDIKEKLQAQIDITDTIIAWKQLSDKKIAVMRWMISNGLANPPEYKELSECANSEEWILYNSNFISFEDMLQEVAYTMNLLCKFIKATNETNLSIPVVEFGNDYIDQFLDADRNIEQTYKERIRPIDIKERRNAIWMSPEGRMYGLNGLIANMLHNRIADKLNMDGIIQYSLDKAPTVDSYLEQLGWLKIHDDWIMFDPFAKSRDFTTVTNFITEEQTVVLVEYLKTHWNGIGRFGIRHNPVSFVAFKSMDKFAKNKLFTY